MDASKVYLEDASLLRLVFASVLHALMPHNANIVNMSKV